MTVESLRQSLFSGRREVAQDQFWTATNQSVLLDQ